MFENNTIFRIYGFEEEPYLFPEFLTPWIYSLEFVRQRFATYYKIFSKYNKRVNFKFPYKIGPFIVKSWNTKTIVEELLGEMKL